MTVELSLATRWVPVIEDITFQIPRGHTLALVGESGCGKSMTALSLLRLLPSRVHRVTGGRALLFPHRAVTSDSVRPPQSFDLLALAPERLPSVRGRHMAMIFQEPITSLNPVLSIGQQLVEVIQLHRGLGHRPARAEALRLLDRVGLHAPRKWLAEYPHQLSGGMCQRVMLAMALSGEPSLLVADEPTTALDVVTQVQVLDLLASLQREQGMSILLITHDLGVVAHYAHSACVMYAGRIVERAPVPTLLDSPRHPYTQALLACHPSRVPPGGRPQGIGGAVPALADYPPGCRFHPRCDLSRLRASEPGRKGWPSDDSTGLRVLHRCVQESSDEGGGTPRLREVGVGHWVACWEV